MDIVRGRVKGRIPKERAAKERNREVSKAGIVLTWL
jgi:hypothetical protein